MKKLLIATALVAVTSMAAAAEVGMSSVRDIGLDKNGVRVTATVGSVAGFRPQLSFTQVNGSYDRWAVGGQYTLAKVGPVAFATVATGVYHDAAVGSDGYGLTAGLKATYALSKTVDVVAGVERFVGQDSISASNATTTSFGLNLKF